MDILPRTDCLDPHTNYDPSTPWRTCTSPTATAAHDLLQDLVKGGLRVARERQAAAKAGGSGAAGPVTIQPEDM